MQKTSTCHSDKMRIQVRSLTFVSVSYCPNLRNNILSTSALLNLQEGTSIKISRSKRYTRTDWHNIPLWSTRVFLIPRNKPKHKRTQRKHKEGFLYCTEWQRGHTKRHYRD